MKTSRELKNQAWDMLKDKNYLNLLLATIVVGIIIAAANFVSFLIAGTLIVGLAKIFLNTYRKEVFKFESIFDFFKENYIQTLLAFILKTIFLFLWSLLIIPGIIKVFSYSMTDYILADNPGMEANDAITKSRELMDGHKFRLFLVMLSFIGWIILAILTLGIGFIFLAPYMNATVTAFYLDLIKEDLSEDKKLDEVEIIIEDNYYND